MKKLRAFNVFDIERFLKNKELRVVGSEIWQKFEDGSAGQIIGTKYKLVIAVDNTIYDPKEPKAHAHINEGEPLTVKVPDQSPKEYKKFSIAKLVEPAAVIYGQFQNELSITAKDIEFV